MAYDVAVPPIDVEQSLDNLKLERDAIVLYDALSSIEKDPRRAAAFERIAGNERRHADIWASKLRDLGADVPGSRWPADARPVHHPGRPAARDRRGRRPRQGARRRRGGRVRRPGRVARGRGDRGRRARARGDLGPAEGRRDVAAVAGRPDPRRRRDRARCPQRGRGRHGTRRGTGPAAGRGRSGRSSSGSATAWSATSRW